MRVPEDMEESRVRLPEGPDNPPICDPPKITLKFSKRGPGKKGYAFFWDLLLVLVFKNYHL